MFEENSRITKTKEGNSLWIDKDRVVNIKIIKVITQEEAYEIIDVAERLLKDSKGKSRVLIQILAYKGPFIASSEFRKQVSKKIKEVIKDPGFEKVAILGGTIIIRTVSSFIITASGVKNMKIFSDKEEALKWLKIK